MVVSSIEEEQKLAELRRAQAALLEKEEKNNKKKENEEFLDSLVIHFNRTFSCYQCYNVSDHDSA